MTLRSQTLLPPSPSKRFAKSSRSKIRKNSHLYTLHVHTSTLYLYNFSFINSRLFTDKFSTNSKVWWKFQIRQSDRERQKTRSIIHENAVVHAVVILQACDLEAVHLFYSQSIIHRPRSENDSARPGGGNLRMNI